MKLLSPLLPLSGILCLLNTGSVNAASELVDIKNQNFGGLELIRACNILPCDQIDFGIDLCAICNVLPKTPPQEPLVSLASRDTMPSTRQNDPRPPAGRSAYPKRLTIFGFIGFQQGHLPCDIMIHIRNPDKRISGSGWCPGRPRR